MLYLCARLSPQPVQRSALPGRMAPVPAAEYPFQMIAGVPVVTAPAEMDITTSAELRATLCRCRGEGHATVVVDLTGTWFCDMAALRELVRAHQRAVADGGGLRLVTPADGALPRIFAVTGQNDSIPRYLSLARALACPRRRDDEARGFG